MKRERSTTRPTRTSFSGAVSGSMPARVCGDVIAPKCAHGGNGHAWWVGWACTEVVRRGGKADNGRRSTGRRTGAPAGDSAANTS
eukprot:4724239-Prymnesium_polylepis.1